MHSGNGSGRLSGVMPTGRSSLSRRPGPRYRWSSSLAAQARSWHLISCRDPERCSRSQPSPLAAGSLDALAVFAATMRRRDSFSTASGAR